MSGIPDYGSSRMSDAAIAEAYRQARETEFPLFEDAPFIELGPERGWSMIRLVDLQTAAALGDHRR